MIGSGWCLRAAFAAALTALLATGCTTGTQVRAIQKSMEPTIRSGEFVELDEYAYDDEDPRAGDIISFRPPLGGDEDLSCNQDTAPDAPCAAPAGIGEGASLMKRVIAVPGDRIAISDDGRAIVNGEVQPEEYIIPCERSDECGLPEPITVIDDHYFVMGDNRPYSGDSREFGPIPVEAVEGKVTPPDR